MTDTDIRNMLMNKVPAMVDILCRQFWDAKLGRWVRSAMYMDQFREYATEDLLQKIQTYRVPSKPTKGYDPALNFFTNYKNHYFTYLCINFSRLLRAERQYQAVTGVSIYVDEIEEEGEEEDKNRDETLDLSADMDLEGQLIQNHLEKLNILFRDTILLYKNERRAFEALLYKDTIKQLASDLGLGEQKAEWYKDEVKYRYAIFCHLKGLPEALDLLPILNKSTYKRMNNRYFGRWVLVAIPLRKDLWRAVMGGVSKDREEVGGRQGKLEDARLQVLVRRFDSSAKPYTSRGTNFVYKSKMDEQGKRHKRYVTYISDTGWAYPFTSKKGWYLGGEDD